MTAPNNQPAEEPHLIITSSAIDFELCELLGDKPSDFLVLLADGKQIPGYGTPYDTPVARSNYGYICKCLNDEKDSLRAEFQRNWSDKLAEICAPESRPVFSFEIHRVCAGHSSHLHCAIRLFEELSSRISSWNVGVTNGVGRAELMMNGTTYSEEGSDLALAIGKAVARALRDAKETSL